MYKYFNFYSSILFLRSVYPCPKLFLIFFTVKLEGDVGKKFHISECIFSNKSGLITFRSQTPTKGHWKPRGVYLQSDQILTDRNHLSELLRHWCEIRGMKFKGEEALPSVGVHQRCQTEQSGPVALQFVTMQCTTVCLCATGGRGKGRGLVWCIFLCLHDRISYTITEKGCPKVTSKL